MKRMSVAALVIVATSLLFGQEKQWKLDKSHSSIGFTVVHMVVSEVYGRFGDFSIDFTSSKEDFSDAAVTVVIKTNSINTDNESRDKDLKSDHFFSAEKFPEIRFTSDSFDKIEGNKYRLVGDLTVRDVTKKAVFDAEYRGSVKTQRGTVMAWKATTTINRFDYGLTWDRMIEGTGLVVGENVTIQVSMELRK